MIDPNEPQSEEERRASIKLLEGKLLSGDYTLLDVITEEP